MTICVLERESSDCDGMLLGVFSTEDLARTAAENQAGFEYPHCVVTDWVWHDGALGHPQVETTFSISPRCLDEFTPRLYAI